MLGEDILFQSVSVLGAQIHDRKISPIELTESYLARMKRYENLGAFARVTADLARSQARLAEKEVNSGRYRSPLHGIPYGAKDLFATAGIPTTWGARPCDRQVFGFDATVIRRLREAGAVLLGKLSMVEFAGGLGYRSARASSSGPAHNPWDSGRWAGGSSSGSGAAVAAALVGFAIGTETWGSILCPSAFCGVTGLRPTYGRVSRFGAMNLSWSFDKIGPMGRSATDCRHVLRAMTGTDPLDPTSSREPRRLEISDAKPPAQLRGAVVRLDFARTKGAEAEVGRAFENAVAALRLMGVKMEDATLPAFPASEIATVIIGSEALASFDRFYRDGTIAQLHDPYAPHQRDIQSVAAAADLAKAWRIRRQLQKAMADFFSRYDVIVTPNYMSVAPSVEDDLDQALPYTDPVGALGNACGLPAIALPAGFGRRNMPVGFQAVAAPFEEASLLALGELYQRQTSFHLQRPPLAG